MARIPRCCGSGMGLAAAAPIGSLAWEPPCAAGAALEKAQRQKKKKKKKNKDIRKFLDGIYVSEKVQQTDD